MHSKAALIGVIARKKCQSMAGTLLKVPLFFSEPIIGIPEPEINYYGFTLVNLLNQPPVNAIKLSGTVADTVLPCLWNYLDGACAVSVGVNQLLDEDNYRQGQMKVKGLLNILSGIQLFLFSYNPPLVAALGITGAPAALAGSSFALSTLIDLITASIDFYNAHKESEINGWLEERHKEYLFIFERINTLDYENKILGEYPEYQDLVEENKSKLAELKTKENQLKQNIIVRTKVNLDRVSEQQLNLLTTTFPTFVNLINEEITKAEQQQNADIQKELNICFQETANTLLIRAASFIGMTLLAVGTFALFTICPPAVAATGLGITVIVAALYFGRHQEIIAHKIEAFKPSALSFFSQQSTEINHFSSLDLDSSYPIVTD